MAGRPYAAGFGSHQLEGSGLEFCSAEFAVKLSRASALKAHLLAKK
jgi:hypothetical protein